MAQMRSVVTLSNSIIGVSILAMPFCFKQCGIILAVVMLYLSGLLVKATSYFLLKSAIMARRRNYETLAFNVFGAAGKLAIEVSMIGFLGGTCIAFFVVIGDLAPPIIAGYIGIENSERLRIGVMLGVGLVVVLPLSLLRNIDSLVALCTASILFYALVMLYIIFTSLESLVGGEWWTQATKWRPAGIFQCLPIFTMALSCQAQLFEVYDTLPDPSLGQMVEIVKGAVNLCSGIYICVGFFGYIAFYSVDFGGNILTAFPDSFGVEITKMGFAISVAVSFPMVIFPCRTSINSIFFAKNGGGSSTDLAKNYIPHERFVFITTCVVLATLFTAIQIPDIELVLGIVGSTIGTVICILFPVSMFIKLVNANTTERLVAQGIFVIGVIVLVLGTYVTLYEADSKHVENQVMNVDPGFAAPHPLAVKPDVLDPQVAMPPVLNIEEKSSSAKSPNIAEKESADKIEVKPNIEVRQEPIQPLPPNDEVVKKEDPVPHVSTESVVVSSSKVNEEKIAEENIKEKEKALEIKERQANKLIKELKVQKKEHQQIIKEQKEVLEQLKEHVDAEKALESNVAVAQKVEVDSTNQLQNNQPSNQDSRFNQPQVQIQAQDQQANLPAANQLPYQAQPFKSNEPQFLVQDNPSPMLNQNHQNVQSNNLNPNANQEVHVNQQLGAQNQQSFQPVNLQPQQMAQNQPNNLPLFANNQQNVQQGIQQSNLNHNIGVNPQNQHYQIPQNHNSINHTNLITQNSAKSGGDYYPELKQVENGNIAPAEKQQKISMASNQMQLPSQQNSIKANNTMGNAVLRRQKVNEMPNSKNFPAQPPSQQFQQPILRQDYGNNQGIPQINRDNNKVVQNSNPPVKSSGMKPNRNQESGQIRDNALQYKFKSSVDNRGKEDTKRETVINAKTNHNSENIKVPGRDLKEAKIDMNSNYEFKNINSRKVKRDADKDNYQYYISDSLNGMKKLPQDQLNTLSVVGVGLGMMKTRNLLSEDVDT